MLVVTASVCVIAAAISVARLPESVELRLIALSFDGAVVAVA